MHLKAVCLFETDTSRFNYIGVAGAVTLARGLEANKGVKTLELNSNEIGDVGIAELADRRADERKYALYHNIICFEKYFEV